MGAGHGHRLHYHGHSVVHRLPAECKIVALFVFVLCVVATPRTAYWAYGLDLLALGGCIAASGVPVGYLAKRMVVELPFVVFAVLLPFIARGERTVIWGVEVSGDGLEAGLSLLAKATIGVIAGLLLAATTEPRDLIAGLEGKLPRQLISIMAMMVRYLDVTSDQMRRMRIARESRGFVARNPKHWLVLAQSAGALFVRSYERGERVHLAMVSRGFTGSQPMFVATPTAAPQWAMSLTLPAVAAAASLTAWIVA
ncbi:MAG: cobalt ECF transporter T component CbiQ [Nocardioidaceae bacterium]